MKKHIGYAIRMIEDENTYLHLDVLREKGSVLWGIWKSNPDSQAPFSPLTFEAVNANGGADFYAVGTKTVWKMHVHSILTTSQVKGDMEEYIPSYYSVETPVYAWLLIDSINDYQGKDELTFLWSDAHPLSEVHQIPGRTPWKVYLKDPNCEEYKTFVPTAIARATAKPVDVSKLSSTDIERRKVTAGLRYDILRRDKFKCQLCGRTAADGITLHVDHIFPISKGGKTEPSNLRTLCNECNLGKSNKIE